MDAIAAAAAKASSMSRVGRDDAGGKSGPLGFRCVHHPAGQAEVHSFGFANDARQPLRTAGARG